MTTMRYCRWAQVPAHLKTRTGWGNAGFQIKSDAAPTAWFAGKYGHYDLFDKSGCIPKCKRTWQPPIVLEFTENNIAAAIYSINKAAKRCRDRASRYHEDGEYDLATKNRRQKHKYYQLKDEAIKLAERLGMAKKVGYHRSVYERESWQYANNMCYWDDEKDNWDGDEASPNTRPVRTTNITHMICWAIGEFRFHTITYEVQDLSQVKDLGEWMSTAQSKVGTMPIKQAVMTIEAFIVEKKEEIPITTVVNRND